MLMRPSLGVVAASVAALLGVEGAPGEREPSLVTPSAWPRRVQEAQGDDAAATRAAAPPWVETAGFACHPNTRWELRPGLTNGKAAWSTSWNDVQWYLYHRPGQHKYWVIDSADDDSSAPVGKTDTNGEDGGPVPRSSNVADDLHTPWNENCDDPVWGNTGHWNHPHHVTVRAPLSPANCDAIAEQAAKTPGCGALRGNGGGLGCSECEHPWIAMAVRHPIMWRDASQCAWAAVCVEEALQQWMRSFPDLPALRGIRDAQAPRAPVGDACLGKWADFTDPCPTYGDNALLGGWPGVICNGTRVVGLGCQPWPAELQPQLVDTVGHSTAFGTCRAGDSPSSFGQCVSTLPSDSMMQMDQLRYVRLDDTGVAELPATLPRTITCLYMQRQNLRLVPAPVSDLVELTQLDLRDNLLRNLTDLSKLQKLTVLKLTNNQLESLPESMFDLSKLQVLWLDVNKLRALPSEIGKLTQLRYLKLDENRIVELPDEIGQLQALQTLQADAAGLTSLPPTINNCGSLEQLYLDSNKLSSFPVISSLTNLTLLRASGNGISFLDNSFVEGLTNLQTLELRGNALSAIPTSVGHLPKLHGLEVSENLLTDLPILYHATELNYLRVSHNAIRQFSQSKLWRSLTSLKELHINHNDIGPSLPDEIEYCVDLTVLIINNNRLTNLPDSMASLRELTELHVQNNALTALPAWTGTLPRLAVLDATNNSILQLPAVADTVHHMYLYQNPINATSHEAERMLADARTLTTFDLSASSASQYIWDDVAGFNRCSAGSSDDLLDANGRLVCVPRLSKPNYCHIDDPCQITVSFMDEYALRSRIGGLTNITLAPLDWTYVRTPNASIWPLLLTDDRNGGYTGVIPPYEMLTKGTHRFQLFKDGNEFWAPQTPDGVYLCDADDTPPYPKCPVELNFKARHCGTGSHPDAIDGIRCECDSKDLTPTSDKTCSKECDPATSVPSADHRRCDCKEGHYDTSKVGLVVCLEDSFNLQRTSHARQRLHELTKQGAGQCLPCPSCLDCKRNESTAPDRIGIPVVKARHRLNLSAHRLVPWNACPRQNSHSCEKYVFDCLGEVDKADGGGDVRSEVCPPFELNNPNTNCSRSHIGALCNSCEEKHILDSGGKCRKCKNIGDLWWLLCVSLVFVGVVPILFGLAKTLQLDQKVYDWLQNKLATKYGKSTDEIDVKASARLVKEIRDLGHFFETTKITISFGQVVALLPGVLGVPDFDMVDFNLPGFGLDLRGTLECFISEVEKTAEEKSGLVNPSQVYFDAWLLHVIGLPMLMFTPVALFMLYQALRQRCTSRDAGGKEKQIGENLRAHAFFCIYLLYPSQAEAIFRVFECRSLGCHDDSADASLVCETTPDHCETCDITAGECDDCPERWLEDDMRVSCNGFIYTKYKRLAQVFVIAIALGFPLLIWTTLYRANRRERQKEFLPEYDDEYEDDSAESGGDNASSPRSVFSRDEQMVVNAYTGHYHQQYYFWEPLDMVRKLILTGLISLLGKGTISQLFVAILVTFFFFCLHIACAPYRNREDNVLKGCADLELFFVMLVTLVKKLGDEDPQYSYTYASNLTDRAEQVPDAFIGDVLQPGHYDYMIVVSFFVNVVAAYIGVVLYKIANIGRAVRYRKARRWRKARKKYTEQLLTPSSSGGLELELSTHDSALVGSGNLAQLSPQMMLSSPAPQTRDTPPVRSTIAQLRSAKLDEVLGLSPQPASEPQ